MPAPTSAGLLLYRRCGGEPEVLLVHPGGPFWKDKDERAWSIPKGLFDPGENPLAAAVREFEEETGLSIEGSFVALTPRKQPSGKIVHAFTLERDLDPSVIRSNSFSMEWPPRSGRLQSFPEVDRAAWFPLQIARIKVHRGQVGFIDELARMLATSDASAPPRQDPKALGRPLREPHSDKRGRP